MDFQNFEKERTRLKDTVLINSNLRVVVATEAPEATSTPRPQSPTGLANEQYSDSSQWVKSSVLEFVQNSFLKRYIFTLVRKDYRRVLSVCSKISDMICDVNLSGFLF